MSTQLEVGDQFRISGQKTVYQAIGVNAFNGCMEYGLVDPTTGKIAVPFAGGVVPRFAQFVRRSMNLGYWACKKCISDKALLFITDEERSRAYKAEPGRSDEEIQSLIAERLTDKCWICEKRRRLFAAREF